MEDPYELIEKYKKEADEDGTINQMNLMDKHFDFAKTKNKWLGRRTACEQDLYRLECQKFDLLKALIEKNPIPLSQVALNKKAERNDSIIELSRLIERQKILQRHLDTALKDVITGMSWQFSGLISQMQMENLGY